VEASIRPIESGVAYESAVPDEPSGDAWLVRPRAGGALIAVLDALGHGPPAAESAAIACTLLAAHPDLPLTSLLKRCHDALRETRGIAIGLAAYDARRSTLEWIAIGNIQGVLVRHGAEGRPKPVPLISRGGIVGRTMPLVAPETLAVRPGDALMMATDGIEPGFADTPPPTADPQSAAERLLSRYRRGNDDALTLVVRFSAETS
jgi:negative regulator of sigma-B (phosphoserine phosphatase)